MSSHYSSIGLKVDSYKEFRELVLDGLDQAIKLPALTDGNQYLRWDIGEGAELWIHCNEDDEIDCIHPHFTGDAVMRVGLTDRVIRDHSSPLEGAFYGWVAPRESDHEGGKHDRADSGAYPIVLDVPDFVRHDDRIMPSIATAQVAAFAHELTVHPDKASYYASQRNAGFPVAAESFIPIGTFGNEWNEMEAYAMLAGTVMDSERLTLPVTGADFYWARVRTLEGEVDLVADTELVPDGLEPGHIVRGMFWLSGRIL